MQDITDDERRWQVEQINRQHVVGAESTIAYAKDALKAIIIINGGAAVAILAFIAQVAKGSPGIVSPISVALEHFTIRLTISGAGEICRTLLC